MSQSRIVSSYWLPCALFVLASIAFATAKEPEQAEAVTTASAEAMDISAGGRHSCVIHNSELECWGDDEYANNGKRSGNFSAVDCGSWHTCALDTAGRASCFGAGYALKASVPEIEFSKISAGFSDTCGIAASDAVILCWGAKSTLDLEPPTGAFSDVSVGTRSACALTAKDGSVKCWGSDEFNQRSGAPTTSAFRQVTCGGGHCCALTQGGRINCWGGSDEYRLGRAIPNTKVPHVQIATGEDHSCTLGRDSTVRCWGRCKEGACDPPVNKKTSKPIEFSAIAAGGLHTCGLQTKDQRVVCWGDVPKDMNGNEAAVPDTIGGTTKHAAITVDARNSITEGLGGMLSRVASGMFAPSSNATEL